MIDKANVIYDRWSAGYELPTVVLGPSTSDDGCDSTNGGTNPGGGLQHLDHYGISVSQYGVEQQQSEPDPFARFHPRLVQYVVEIRQRAKSLLLSRNASQPPTWGPPVIHSPCSPVLPPEVPQFARISYSQNGLGNGNDHDGMSSESSPSFYSNTVLHAGAAFPQWAPSTSMALSPTSKMAIVDTINFELEALNDQSWMAFF